MFDMHVAALLEGLRQRRQGVPDWMAKGPERWRWGLLLGFAGLLALAAWWPD